MSSLPQIPFEPQAFAEDRLWRKLLDDPVIYDGLREAFLRRRDLRREQIEASAGEVAILMRGRCQELTAILNELFTQRAKER